MLILTRKSGETITIGDDIHIRVLGVKGGQVRIGVDAPREVSVNREELSERTRAEDGTVVIGDGCLSADSVSKS